MAVKANITIDQGTDFSTSIDVTDDGGEPTDLTGFTGTAQLRKHYTSANSHAFTVSVANGSVTLSMNSAITANISSGRYVYDCELASSSNVVTRIVEGIVTITPQVTR